VKHIYSTGVIYDRHLQSSKYFYNTGHRSLSRKVLYQGRRLPLFAKVRLGWKGLAGIDILLIVSDQDKKSFITWQQTSNPGTSQTTRSAANVRKIQRQFNQSLDWKRNPGCCFRAVTGSFPVFRGDFRLGRKAIKVYFEPICDNSLIFASKMIK